MYIIHIAKFQRYQTKSGGLSVPKKIVQRRALLIISTTAMHQTKKRFHKNTPN